MFNHSVQIYSIQETEAVAYCKKLAQSHYENFHVASFFLPKDLRTPFYIVYAFCRTADDLADEHDGSLESRRNALLQLDDWHRQLEQCFNVAELDESAHPVFIALQDVLRRYNLPKEPFADLLTAFRQDQTKTTYATFDELLDYCRCSADPVGRIVLHLIGHPTQNDLLLSDSICTALQLANFWQDVRRDLVLGRCYIPQDIALQYSVDLNCLQDSPEFRRMMKELVFLTRHRFQLGEPLIQSVPLRFRPEISLFIRGGSAILDAVERAEYNVLEHRPVLSKWTKLRLLAETFLYRGKYSR